MFPVGTGMNRRQNEPLPEASGVPRRYGDEPEIPITMRKLEIVFPVGTGMNRVGRMLLGTIKCVPRRYGDEPLIKIMPVSRMMCSP